MRRTSCRCLRLLRRSRRELIRRRASYRKLHVDDAAFRECRLAAARWPRTEMAERPDGQVGGGDRGGDCPRVWPGRAVAPVGESLLVPVVRGGDGDGLAFLRHHHQCHWCTEARPDTFVRRTWHPCLRRARQPLAPDAA